MRLVGAWVLSAAVGFLLVGVVAFLAGPPHFWGLIPLTLATLCVVAVRRLIPYRSWGWIVAAACCLGGVYTALALIAISIANST